MFWRAYSELKPKGQLDRARPADLIKGAETTIRASTAEAACERLGRVAEKWVRQVIVGRAEVRMVKDIEELRAETKTDFLRHLKYALEGDIRLRRAEAAQDIAPEITPLVGGSGSEGCFIENYAARILRAEEFERHTWYKIRPRI